ncbi:MAG: hypothetical protein HYU51_14150 [Candidatus Rokubacteria bacterium]|nr:hypothetical protein [Candidatus Rokubacteria bacterium]
MSGSGSSRRHARRTNLQQAASTIFVLTALLPLLIFVWIIYVLDAMHDVRVQVGLGLSLLVSMLGFAILRITMRRTSEVLQLLVRAEARPAVRPAADIPAGAPAAGQGAVRPPADRQPSAASAPATPPAARAERKSAGHSVDVAPAIGAIQELHDAAEAVIRRWRREAEVLLGRPVMVHVENLDQPECGILARVSEVGIVLEQEGQEFGVMWKLIASIELDPLIEPAAQPVG